MLFIDTEGNYPRHIGDIQLVSSGYKYGDALPAGWTEVTPSIPPTAGLDEVVEEVFPTEINGVMTQTWKVRPMTAAEIERRDAPLTAKAKLKELGLTDIEIQALVSGLVR